MSLNSDFKALSNQGLFVQIFQDVRKLVRLQKPPWALTLRKSARQQRVNMTFVSDISLLVDGEAV